MDEMYTEILDMECDLKGFKPHFDNIMEMLDDNVSRTAILDQYWHILAYGIYECYFGR
jgi:hypothetical protein